MVLYSQNYGGNLHEVVYSINKAGLAELVHSIHDVSPNITIVIFKISEKMRAEWWARDRRTGEPR